jgi:hypothetical protein
MNKRREKQVANKSLSGVCPFIYIRPNTNLSFASICFIIVSLTLPNSPMIIFLSMVAILSTLITDEVFKPDEVKSGC